MTAISPQAPGPSTCGADFAELGARGWRNHQVTLTRGSGTGPVLNLRMDEVLPALRSLTEAISSLYGWEAPVLPDALETYEGHWRSGSQPPEGWPVSANERKVVSLAVTAGSRLCWTEPGDLAEVLP